MPKAKAKEEKKTASFDTPEARDTFWHSTAHILAHAVTELYPNAKPTIGPPVENGFYYDFADLAITPADFPKIEKKMNEIVGEDCKFERMELGEAEAKKLFKANKFKLEMIEELVKAGEKLTAYKEGDFIDLCRGPHVPSTGYVRAFKLTKIAGAYWRGDVKNPQLTRIYGISFPSEQQLKEFEKILAEAEKRDHRKIGRELDLFSFNELAPGAAFWHPKGMIIFRQLEKFWREMHDNAGYAETSTPIMVKKGVFEQSGHWEYYKQFMFKLDFEGETFCLKPMNCPESTFIYRARARSYRDLPLRISEIGRLHRAELSGVLSGMFRVRQITMDDAHIYCTPEQIQQEISNLIGLIKKFYSTFGLAIRFTFSTKPEKAMGEPKLWERAEQALEQALKQNRLSCETKPGEGAFYGPKIDMLAKDCLGREWQMATIQLDFQLPERFKLDYTDRDNRLKRPVIIHRAVFGSFERFIGILTEHFAGKFPLWLSPEQVRILTIADRFAGRADEAAKKLKEAGIRVEVDAWPETINKKVRDAQLSQVPYILVVGEREQKNKTVNVRTRNNEVLGEMKVEKLLERLLKEIEEKK